MIRNRIAERFWNALFILWTRVIVNPYIAVRRYSFRGGYPTWAGKVVKFQKRLERIRWAIYDRWYPRFEKLPREWKNRILDGKD